MGGPNTPTTLGGVTLYTVFTPWFALMMIWLFAFRAGWFPIGKFLDPVVWQDAPTDANTVFNRMLLTVIVLSGIVFAVFIVTTRRRVSGAGYIRLGSVAISAAVLGGGVAGLGHRVSRLGHRQAYGPADSDIDPD